MTTISGLGGIDYAALTQRVSAKKLEIQGDFKLPDLDSGKTAKPGAAQTIDQALRDLSESHNLADKMVLDLASGRDLNIHNTMIALEQADIALKYTVQLRNRALSAYEELMRIQV
jgi:flagellar hook-basal body complex protein FliE